MAASAHGGSGLANVTGLLLRGDRFEVLRHALLVGVGHAFAAAGAQAILRDRVRQLAGHRRLGALERLPYFGRQRLPRGVVLLERLGARRRAAPFVFLGGAHAPARVRRAALHAVHQVARALQFLVVLLLHAGEIAAALAVSLPTLLPLPSFGPSLGGALWLAGLAGQTAVLLRRLGSVAP